MDHLHNSLKSFIFLKKLEKVMEINKISFIFKRKGVGFFFFDKLQMSSSKNPSEPSERMESSLR